MSAQNISFYDWLIDNGFDEPRRVYEYLFNQVKDAAAVAGIDLGFHDLDVSRSSKVKKLTPIVQKDKGKVVAFVSLLKKEFKTGGTTKELVLPHFNFYTNKGDFSNPYSPFSALRDIWKRQNPVSFSDKPKSNPADTKPKATPKADYFKEIAWKEKQVDLWDAEYNAASDLVAESLYLQRKFRKFKAAQPFFQHGGAFGGDADYSVDCVELAANAAKESGVRFGSDKHGNFLIIKAQNIRNQLMGFQKIYDFQVNFSRDDEPDYRDKDQRFFHGQKNGSFVRLGKGAKFDDYVFVVEGFATGLSVHIATGNNVLIAGDAGNLVHVLKAAKDYGYKRLVISADNDIGDKGNTGVFSALKAAKAHGARIFVPQNDGHKCDFNDVLLDKGLSVVKKQLATRLNKNEFVIDKNVFEGSIQLLSVCRVETLKKHIWFSCANAVSNYFNMDMDTAERRIIDALVARGVDVETARADVKDKIKKAEYSAVKRCKFRNTGDTVGFQKVVECTGRTNESIAAEILENPGIWLDNRPMGTGKTELIGAITGLGVMKGLTSTYICHRQSLVANSSERIRAISYKTVNSAKELAHEQSMALCINSIINPRFSAYVTQHSSIISCDEIRQTLEHLAIGSIAASERKLVYDAFVQAIRNCEYFIGSDADLNQVTIDWLKNTFPEKKFYGLRCDPKPPKAMIEYSHYEPAFNAAVESALSGTSTLIQCDSIKASKAVFEAVNRPHLKVLVVHSENKADLAQAQFLINPNEEIKKYDCVIHSPVIGSGVSITCDHIKAHYALFRGVLTENEVLQMIGRNRNSSIIRVGFNDKHIKNRVNSPKILYEGELVARQRLVDGEHDVDSLGKLMLKIRARSNDSLNDVAVQSLLLMRLKGYQVRRFEGDASKEQLVAARKCARKVHCEGVLGSDDITALDAYKLEKAESVTQEESYRLEKYNAVYELALPSKPDGKPDITADDVVFYDSGRVVRTIHNREIANATPYQREVVDKNTGGFKSVAKGYHIDILLMIMTDKVMDQYHAAVIMGHLNKHHAELAALGLGNYSTPSKYPIRTVNQFLEQFGYKLVGKKISFGERKGDRVYRLVSDERIEGICERRTVQNNYLSVADGAIDNNTN
jgi:hypothetical protein